MTEIVHVRAEPLPNCTGLADTPAVCMGVAEMLYVCTGVAETPPNWTGVVGTPPLSQKKRDSLMTTSGGETLEVVGSIMATHFYTKP